MKIIDFVISGEKKTKLASLKKSADKKLTIFQIKENYNL